MRAILVATTLGAALLLPATLHAQVDCSNPDNLCTGDPCVVPTLEVQVPCVADFGARTLVIAGTLRVGTAPYPNPNDVSLTAGRIEVPGGIRVPRSRFPNLAGPVTLSATDDIIVTGRLGASCCGNFNMIAGGDIDFLGRARRLALGTLDAGGTLLLDGGTLQPAAGFPFRGAAGVVSRSRLRYVCGNIAEISSSAGTVSIEAPVNVRHPNAPCRLAVTAAGDVIVNATLLGGGISLTSTGGGVTINRPVRSAGRVIVDAAGAVLVDADVLVDPVFAGASEIRMDGASVAVSARARVDGSRFGGGELRFTATATDLALGGTFAIEGGDGAGGVIEAIAAGNITADGNFSAAGSPPGCIAFQAGGTLDTSGGSFDPAPVVDCPD